MIELRNVNFSYTKKGTPALCGLTATIRPGIHLLAGENGAGKTTLLNLMAGLSSPSSGECLVDGVPASADCPSLRSRIFMLEEQTILPAKTINIFKEIHSQFYPTFSEEAFRENLSDFGMTGDEKLKSLSLGNRKKAILAYVLALGVDYLFLDEPTNALDIESKEKLRKIISRSVGESSTLIVATHTVSELENLFDGAVILNRSRLALAATEEEIAGSLEFASSRFPIPEALYSEMRLGGALNVLKAGEEGGEGRVDWRLLYSALHSPGESGIRETVETKLNRYGKYDR